MNKIHYIEIGGAYQLIREYRVQTGHKPKQRIFFRFTILDVNGLLTLKRGFAWDGATCARDTKTIMRGAAGHDASYELIRQGLLSQDDRDIADTDFKRVCLEDGMNGFRAGYVYEAVEHLAADAASPDNKREEHSAP